MADSFPDYNDFKPFIDFLFGTIVTLIIVLFRPIFFTKEQKTDYQFKASMYILAGFASVLLIKFIFIYLAILCSLIIWVPIYITVHLFTSNPDSYLPTVIPNISTIVISFIFGIIAILVKPKLTYKVYAYLGFVLGLLIGTALFYSLNSLFLLLIFIGITGAFTMNRVGQSTNFQKSDLTYANFTSANLEATDFAGAKLTNTDFTDAKF